MDLFITVAFPDLLSPELVFLFDTYSGSHIFLHCDEKFFDAIAKQHGLLLMNHSFDLDWLATWCVADRYGQLFVSITSMNMHDVWPMAMNCPIGWHSQSIFSLHINGRWPLCDQKPSVFFFPILSAFTSMQFESIFIYFMAYPCMSRWILCLFFISYNTLYICKRRTHNLVVYQNNKNLLLYLVSPVDAYRWALSCCKVHR